MKKIIFAISIRLIVCSTVQSQPVVIDRSKQKPVTVNSIFFKAFYSLTNDENRKVTFADMGLGLGQIFTYKGEKKALEDLQSLTLIEAYIYDEKEEKYVPYNEYDLALPHIQYDFKLVLACMSSMAAAPGGFLNGNDIEPSGLAVNREYIANFKLNSTNQSMLNSLNKDKDDATTRKVLLSQQKAALPTPPSRWQLAPPYQVKKKTS